MNWAGLSVLAGLVAIALAAPWWVTAGALALAWWGSRALSKKDGSMPPR